MFANIGVLEGQGPNTCMLPFVLTSFTVNDAGGQPVDVLNNKCYLWDTGSMVMMIKQNLLSDQVTQGEQEDFTAAQIR